MHALVILSRHAPTISNMRKLKHSILYQPFVCTRIVTLRCNFPIACRSIAEA